MEPNLAIDGDEKFILGIGRFGVDATVYLIVQELVHCGTAIILRYSNLHRTEILPYRHLSVYDIIHTRYNSRHATQWK